MDRRTFLGTASLVTGAAIAGCLDSADGGSDAGDAPNGDAGSDDVGAYSRALEWAPPVDDGDEPPIGYGIYTRSISQFLEVDDELEMDVAGRLQFATSFDWGRIDPAELELDLEIGPGDTSQLPAYRVLQGPFDKASLREKSAEIGEHAGSREGYDIYGGVVDESLKEELRDVRAVAVGDDAVIVVGTVDDTEATADHARDVVDAVTAPTDSIVERDEAVAAVASRIEPGATSLLNRVDPDRATDVELGEFAGTEAVGVVGTFEDSTMQMREVHWFEAADAVQTEALDEYVSQQEAEGTTDTSDYSVDGRVVTVTSTTSVESIFQQ